MKYKATALLFVLTLIPASTAISAPPVPGDDTSIENNSQNNTEQIQNNTTTNTTSETWEENGSGFIQTLIEIFGSII